MCLFVFNAPGFLPSHSWRSEAGILTGGPEREKEKGLKKQTTEKHTSQSAASLP